MESCRERLWTSGEHGHVAGFTVRAAGEDRGAAAAGCADRRAGAGAGPEGRADPEAAERAGQVPLGDPARHAAGAAAERPQSAGRAADQAAGDLGRAHRLRHPGPQPRHAPLLPQEPAVSSARPPARPRRRESCERRARRAAGLREGPGGARCRGGCRPPGFFHRYRSSLFAPGSGTRPRVAPGGRCLPPRSGIGPLPIKDTKAAPLPLSGRSPSPSAGPLAAPARRDSAASPCPPCCAPPSPGNRPARDGWLDGGEGSRGSAPPPPRDPLPDSPFPLPFLRRYFALLRRTAAAQSGGGEELWWNHKMPPDSPGSCVGGGPAAEPPRFRAAEAGQGRRGAAPCRLHTCVPSGHVHDGAAVRDTLCLSHSAHQPRTHTDTRFSVKGCVFAPW